MVGRRQGASSTRDEHRTRDERGASAVEFALVAPIFIALLFGIISWGWMLSYRQGMSQAAAEGARVIAVAPSGANATTTKSKAIDQINDALGSYGVTCTSAGSLTHGGTTVGSCAVSTSSGLVKVTITHDYRAHPLIPSFPGLGIVLPERLTYTTSMELGS